MLVLDSLEDPQNVGTLLRSAEAAGVHGVLFPTHRQAPLTPSAVKASAGATEHLLLCPVDDLPGGLADLHVRGLRVAGAEADASLTVRQTDLRGPLALVVGSEGQGLGPAVRRRCDLFMRIPMRGAIGSLNAAVAGSILLFEALAQRDPDGRSTPPAPFDAPRAPEPGELATTDTGPSVEAIPAEPTLDATPVAMTSAVPGADPKRSKAADTAEEISSTTPAGAVKPARTPKPAKEAKGAKPAKAAKAAALAEDVSTAKSPKPAKTPKPRKPAKEAKAAKPAKPAALAEPVKAAKEVKATKPPKAATSAKPASTAKPATATQATATTAKPAKPAKAERDSIAPAATGPADVTAEANPPKAAKRTKAPAPRKGAPTAKPVAAPDDDLLPGEPAARSSVPATPRTRKPRTPRA